MANEHVVTKASRAVLPTTTEILVDLLIMHGLGRRTNTLIYETLLS